MKKLIIMSSLAVLNSVGLSLAASTGTITFNGELTANTCEVTVDGQAADAVVVLPTVGINQLQTVARTAGDTGFVMLLNNCAGTLQTASAFFQAGTTVDIVTGRLKNIGGNANNVSLQLLDGSSASTSVIQVGAQDQRINTVYKSIANGSASLPYIVRYYAEAPVTAGTVVSNVVYSIQYQ